jgi:hypothetical protein
MKVQKKLLTVAVMALATASLSTAYASWDDLTGGYGVVSFTSSNPAKIIFLDQVRPYESGLGLGTNRTNYDTYLGYSNARTFRNVYPSGSKPTETFNPQRAGADYTRLTTEGPMVWTHISKSAGAECLINQTNCAYPGQISSSSSCSYNRVKVTATGELSAGVEKSITVQNADLSSSIGGGISLTKEWESGWQACQSEGSSHSCPPDQNLTFNAVNYATTEARSKFGWQRFVTSGSTFYFNDRYRSQDVTFCETTIGGTYQSGGFLIEPKVGRCNVWSSSKKPTWERYERMPIPNTASLQTIIPTCRTIKKA